VAIVAIAILAAAVTRPWIGEHVLVTIGGPVFPGRPAGVGGRAVEEAGEVEAFGASNLHLLLSSARRIG
jgi:hypothetical protein